MSQPGGYTEKGLRWIVMEIVMKVLALHYFHKINVTKLYWAVLIICLISQESVNAWHSLTAVYHRGLF